MRTKRNPKEWLLIKKVDGHAREGDEAAFSPESVYSGLTVEALGAGDTPAERLEAELEAAGAPRRTVNASSLAPMLAKVSEQPFSRRDWLFELKYDGYRMIAGVDAGQPYLRYRNGGEVTELFPEIVPALRALPLESLVMDGEVVVLDETARPDFGRLAKRARLSRESDILPATAQHPATFFVFDLLALNGFDLRDLPLRERKRYLEAVVPRQGPVRFAEHVDERGSEMFEHVQRLGLEGVMAKNAAAPYRAGRSDQWLKMRADRTANLVVVGYAKGKGARRDFGALLVAVNTLGGLRYLGRVGTGFRERQVEELRGLLGELETESPPLVLPDRESAVFAHLPSPEDAVWVRPEVCCAVRFKEVTADGLLRHPVFERLHPDLLPRDCDVGQSALAHAEALHESTAELPPGADEARSGEPTITRPDKVFWPEEGYTKGDLIEYYRAVADWILPYLADRPLVLDRYPDGIGGKSFFQKHAPHFTPEWMRTVTIHSDSGDRDVDYFVVEDVDALVYVANSAAIPLHVWSSRVETLDRPDWTVLDLDPKEASFADVVRVARAIRELCGSIGLPCYAKTSGKTGMHVLVPLGRQVSYEHSRMLADLLALIVSRRYPEIATVNRSLQSRGDKVYIDAVQNGAGRLLVAPLCVRPFAGATVSTPLRWSEVNSRLDMHRFTIRSVPARLRRMKNDPLLAVLDDKPALLDALRMLAEIEGE